VSVLNAYYSLAADYDDLKAKQDALDTAQKFFDEAERGWKTGRSVGTGRHHRPEPDCGEPPGTGQFAGGAEQQELQLKNLISRMVRAMLCSRDVEIVPVVTWSSPPPTIFLPSKSWSRKRCAIAAILLWSETI